MKAVSLFLLLLTCSITVTAQDKIQMTAELLDKYYSSGQLNGVVLVAEDGKILLRKTFGYADFEAMEEIRDSSVFVLASISKTLTAMGILKLIDEGKLSLSDELVKFFPELPYKGVTIRHMVSNTSGLPEYRELFAAKWDRTKTATNKDVIKMMSENKPSLLFRPGTQFRYSNTGFVFLASVIEKVTGRDYEEFMREEVFKPLGMSRSLIFTRDKEYNIGSFAFPYLRAALINPVMVRPETLPQLDFINYLDGIKGDVSAAASAEDLYNLDIAVMSGKYLDNELLREALTPVVTEQNKDEGYGYGWFMKRNAAGEKIVFHEGGMPGISTANMMNLDAGRIVIVLSNTNFTRALNIAENISLIFEGGEPIEPKLPLPVEMAAYISRKGLEGLHEYAEELITSGNYQVLENEINAAGYEMLQGDNIDAALEFFKLNVELFPGSWNAYDSLGEGYMTKGDKELAIMNYKKSLELNPENENGKNMLKKLEGNF